MTDRHAQAARAALVKLVGEQIKDAKDTASTAITDSWRPKDRAAAVLPGGQEIGSVTLTSGSKKARISDARAFEAWVERVHPEALETITITRPDPAFVERLLSAARKLGVAIDAETGEQVPGMDVVVGDPYPMVKLADDAAELVAAAWQDGQLVEVVGALLRPAVEGGGQS